LRTSASLLTAGLGVLAYLPVACFPGVDTLICGEECACTVRVHQDGQRLDHILDRVAGVGHLQLESDRFRL
jgi:hypothetical protein